MKLEDSASWKKSYDKFRQHIKKQRHHFANKGSYSQSYGFSSSHVLMWELDYKESWALKSWYFHIVVLEKTLESPLDSEEIKRVHPKGNQPWIFIGRTDAEAEAPVLWPSDTKSWLIGKDLDAGKNWRQKKKAREDEIIRWHHRFNGHELGHILGDGEGQGGLAYCSPCGHKESDRTWQLNNNNNTKEMAIEMNSGSTRPSMRWIQVGIQLQTICSHNTHNGMICRQPWTGWVWSPNPIVLHPTIQDTQLGYVFPELIVT